MTFTAVPGTGLSRPGLLLPGVAGRSAATNPTFTQISLTGVVWQSPGMPAPGATVTMTLSAVITDGTTEISPIPVSRSADNTGAFLITVPANNDPTTTPQTTFYKVVITYANQTLDAFKVMIPYRTTPVDLFSLPRL